MPKVFVDTNAFLGFFAYTSDDLAELKKLVDEMKSGKVELLLTDQVQHEFARNREAKIAETLKGFKEKAGINQFPKLIQQHADYEKLKDIAQSYTDLKDTILTALNADIISHNLPADVTFGEISKVAKIIKTAPEILATANTRMAIGNPPGKRGSLGDAINWELLLQAGLKSDLYIVTQDSDYLSPLDKTRFSEFLREEWRARCSGEVHLFETLRNLFKKIAPEIKLSSATASALANTVYSATAEGAVDEVEMRVRDLEQSHSFRRTHAAISALPDFWELSNGQRERLFRAAVENGEIASIHSDDDVSKYFKTLHKFCKDMLPTDIAETFTKLYLTD